MNSRNLTMIPLEGLSKRPQTVNFTQRIPESSRGKNALTGHILPPKRSELQSSREIEKLKFLNENLLMVQKKKDEILMMALDENKRLHEEIESLKNQLRSRDFQLEELRRDQPLGVPKKEPKPQVPKQTKGPRRTYVMQHRQHQSSLDLNNLFANKKREQMARKCQRFLDAKGLPQVLGFGNFEEVIAEERYGVAKLLENPRAFQETVKELSEAELNNFVETIKGINDDYKLLFQVIERIKRLIGGLLSISHRCEEREAFSKNVDLICDILNCERASIFMYDSLRQTLWSVEAKGSRRIEIASNQGIAGAVFTDGNPINIEDAYTDKRFNKEVDLRNDFRTRSILCVPIYDDDGERIGICQAINCRNKAFSTDDERLLEYLSRHAGTILMSSFEFQQHDIIQDMLRRVINAGSELVKIHEPLEFLHSVEDHIKRIFGSDNVIVCIVGAEQLMKLAADGKSFTSLPISGLLGEAVKSNKVIDCKRSSLSPCFNMIIDIDTSESVRCVPVHINAKSETVLAFEYVNKKHVMCTDKEVLEYLTRFICIAWDGLLFDNTDFKPQRGFIVSNRKSIVLIPT